MQNISLIMGIISMLNNFIFTGSNTEKIIWLITYNLLFSIVGTIISITAMQISVTDTPSMKSKIGLALCSASLLYYAAICGIIYMVKDL